MTYDGCGSCSGGVLLMGPAARVRQVALTALGLVVLWAAGVGCSGGSGSDAGGGVVGTGGVAVGNGGVTVGNGGVAVGNGGVATGTGGGVAGKGGAAGTGGIATGTGGGAGGGSGTTCAPCAGDEVCVAGKCTKVPAQCPCPKETYCDLATSRCVVGCTMDDHCDTSRICTVATRTCGPGCRTDDQCGTGKICESLACRTGCRTDAQCGTGNICESLTCRAGCRADADCGAGKICDALACRAGCRTDANCSGQLCDPKTLVCRTGCKSTAECALETICNTATLTCEAGCDTDARCSSGRICQSGACVAGCREDSACPAGQVCSGSVCRSGCRAHTDCPLQQVCNTVKTCTSGCGLPGGLATDGITSRCPVGTACAPAGCDINAAKCTMYRCTADCYGWPCAASTSQPFKCWKDYYDNQRCMEPCARDSDCVAPQICHAFVNSGGLSNSTFCTAPCGTCPSGCTCNTATGKCERGANNCPYSSAL